MDFKYPILALQISLFATTSYGFNSFNSNLKIVNNGTYLNTTDRSGSESLRKLKGHVPRAITSSIKQGTVGGDTELNLSIVLELNASDELNKTLQELYDPSSPRFHQFLTTAEFVAKFSPTQQQVDQAQEFLRENGIQVNSVDSNRLIIHASGQSKAINEAFHTEVSFFKKSDGSLFHAPVYELQVPNTLKIQAVAGLDNQIKHHPNFVRKTVSPRTLLQDPRGTGPNGALSPADIRTAYNIPANLDGSGQTLALFELDGYNPNDIATYNTQFKIPTVPIRNILIDGFSGQPSADGSQEVTLDIELMEALAPGASILVYEGPNTEAGAIHTYNKIATDNIAKSISTSWGLSEDSANGSEILAENSIFAEMAAQGQSIFAASGDQGAYDGGTSTLSVDDPASQPFVVAVGATSLTLGPNSSYGSETTWNNSIGASGGGISSKWTIPTYQVGSISTASKGSATQRNVPDVSINGDPNRGYAIFTGGSWYSFGGTSCGAPLWAAFTALVNQQRAQNQLSPLGFANPPIYQLVQNKSTYAALFHDIADASTNLFYPAVSGLDNATGWGSLIGAPLLQALSGSTNPPPPSICTQANPSVVISPSSQTGAVGSQLEYTVSVMNNDSSSCATSSFNFSLTLPSQFSGALGGLSLSIAPQTTSSTKLKIMSGPNAAQGNYTLTVKATNSTAASLSGFGTAVAGVITSGITPAQKVQADFRTTRLGGSAVCTGVVNASGGTAVSCHVPSTTQQVTNATDNSVLQNMITLSTQTIRKDEFNLNPSYYATLACTLDPNSVHIVNSSTPGYKYALFADICTVTVN